MNHHNFTHHYYYFFNNFITFTNFYSSRLPPLSITPHMTIPFHFFLSHHTWLFLLLLPLSSSSFWSLNITVFPLHRQLFDRQNRIEGLPSPFCLHPPSSLPFVTVWPSKPNWGAPPQGNHHRFVSTHLQGVSMEVISTYFDGWFLWIFWFVMGKSKNHISPTN